MVSMKEWALKYASMGLRVFPVRKGTKGATDPATKKSGQLLRSWKEEATMDPNVIAGWWSRWPDADICIATGNGLTVIDMDIKHPPDNGIETVEEWELANAFFPRTAAVRTGSGGRHLYFYTPNSTIKNMQSGKFRPGVDVKSERGYVVAPPSVGYSWEDDTPIAVADQAVLTFLRNQDLKGKVMQETPEGNRNNTLRDQIWKLACQGVPEEDTLAQALAMNQLCVPPEEESVIIQMVKRAYKKREEESTAGIINLESVEPEEVEWLWYPYIPKGKITIIAGAPGVGKTFIEAKIAALVSTGQPFPGEDEERKPGIVCIQNTEDGLADTIVKRLIASGANLKMIKMIDDEGRPLTFTDPRLENFMQRFHPELIVFDPFQSFFGAGIDLHRANETRPVFDRLLHLAQQYKVAVILVMHLSKMTNASAINRILGSVDVVGSVRSVLIIAEHPKMESQKVISHEKSNLAPKGESICYRIDEAAAVEWQGFCTLTADDCLQTNKAKAEKNKLQIAIEMIASRLKDSEKVSVKELRAAAAEVDISYSTLKRARANMGLEVEKKDFIGDTFWKYS